MAKTKIEKIASIEEEIKQLRERQKLLQQQHNAQERKDRTKRLCRRMGLFESLLPATIPLTDEQFKIFLEKTVATEPARRILDGLTAQNAATATAQGAEPAAGADTPPEGRTYIPHECGMCGLADGVLCLSAQKKTAGKQIPRHLAYMNRIEM